MKHLVSAFFIIQTFTALSQCSLITNGDFEQYNTTPIGFTSPDHVFSLAYPNACVVWAEFALGKTICPNPAGQWVGYSGDHTTGTGNALFIDVNPYAPQAKLYAVNIVTTPGQQYRFGYWGKNINSQLTGVDPSVDLMVDNVAQGSTKVFNYNSGAWQYKDYVFTAGNTSTNLTLIHTYQQNGTGHDFAMDDACAEPVLDSVQVNYLNPSTSLCIGDTAYFQFVYYGFNGSICFEVDNGTTASNMTFQNNQIYKAVVNANTTFTFSTAFCTKPDYLKSYAITASNQLFTDITSTNICDGNPNSVSISGANNGIFSLVAPVLGSATVDANTGVIANYTAPGAYILQYNVGTGGCVGSDRDTVIVSTQDVASITMNDFCAPMSGTPQITGTTGGLFSFAIPAIDGAIINSTSGIISNAGLGSSYSIQYTSPGFCPVTVSTSVSVLAPSNPSFVYNDFCPGSVVLPIITGDPGGVFDFSIAPTDGATIDSTSGQITTTSDDIDYAVRYTVGACANSSVVNVNVYVKPRGILSGNGDLCDLNPDSLRINFTGTAPFDFTFSDGFNVYNYLNYNGMHFSQNINENKTFSIISISDANCTGDVSGLAIFQSQDILFSVDQPNGCPGFTGNFQVMSPIHPSATCTWNFGDGNTFTGCTGVQNVFSIEGCQDVELTILATTGCTGTTIQPDLVCTNPLPQPNFESFPAVPTFLDNVAEFFDASVDAENIAWTVNGILLSNENSIRYDFPLDSSTTHRICLIAESDLGCLDTLCKEVKIEEAYGLFVPNTFTPNDNDLNEVFIPVVTQAVKYDFSVLNRWGDVIFRTLQPNQGWDGTLNNEKVPQGMYLWHIELTNKNGKEIIKDGNVFVSY